MSHLILFDHFFALFYILVTPSIFTQMDTWHLLQPTAAKIICFSIYANPMPHWNASTLDVLRSRSSNPSDIYQPCVICSAIHVENKP